MIQTYRISGIARSVFFLVVGFVLASFFAILIWVGTLGANIILLVAIGVLFTKYSLGFLVFRIDVDPEKRQICFYRSWGRQCINASEVMEWGYRKVWGDPGAGWGDQRNIELRLKSGKRYVYPVHFFAFQPSEAWEQELADCLGSSPAKYSTKYLFSLESGLLFVIL